MGRELVFHPRADPAIYDRAIGDARRCGTQPRVAIGRVRPPVEHALARVERQQILSEQHRIENRRRRPERAVEIQRLADADDVFEPFVRVEALRIDPPQPIAGIGQIVGRRACAKPLEVSAGRDEIGGVGASGSQPRLLGRVDRRFVLMLVIEEARPRERVVRRVRGRKATAETAEHAEPDFSLRSRRSRRLLHPAIVAHSFL